MATRTSIRPRPVDVGRQLTIVRDVAELDNNDELDGGPGAAPAAVSEQAAAAGHQKKKKEVKEIPVPEVRIVAGYTREYLPLFRIPETYIRSKGGIGWTPDVYCEYDLDGEDEDWLDAFNAGEANRLSEEKFELMLWRLETANAEANQRLMAEPGYATDWRLLPAAVAATSNMTRDEALSVLRKHACARDPILAAVYDYWKGKRERMGKPIMRRLQAPTNPSDTNPYNVFRPRERVNRPQTRRRRENTQDCLDKLRQIRESMLKSLEMTELLTFREARKRDMHRLDVDLHRYQLARHHQPPAALALVEADARALLAETQARSRQGESRLRSYLDNAASLGASPTSYDIPLRRALLRKRRRLDMEGCINGEAISRLPPQPLPADDEMLHLFTPDVAKLAGAPPPQAPGTSLATLALGAAAGNGGGGSRPPLIALNPALDLRCVRARVSRCGRTMITRCDPLTLEPHSPMEPPGTSGPGPAAAAAAGVTAPPPVPATLVVAARHPMLISSQTPSVPWAATLDLDLLPEGIVDKAVLRSQRDRRLNAERYNAATLRQAQQQVTQQAAGGVVGATSVAGAAAAAAAAAAGVAAAAATGAAAAAGGAGAPGSGSPAGAAATAAAGAPAAVASTPAAVLATAGAAITPVGAARPPPPTMPLGGAPAGTLPHVQPSNGAPAGTLPHVAPGAPAPVLPPVAGAAPLGAGVPGVAPLAGAAAHTPGAAVGVGQAAARKVPKVAGAPALGGAAAGAGVARSPANAGGAVKQTPNGETVIPPNTTVPMDTL
ncbi:hypothetical protein HYH03_003872 [Edaphochlamys debaryana]|uniref:Enhancer of polycomb-like protein n=1 Tax=Edaphochlamys debaryana TaxID=47281 RepID=A0A836C3W2_9CHLO|nr:hypothetical protein HYH03_003872 [Edaphochlamys debaryana]|eukprot:KAG2498114.1 hypothetical protein HYH03_003872 [Edaphochlamys debaryana]